MASKPSIPPSTHSVSVRIIDTLASVHAPSKLFLAAPLIEGFDVLRGTCFSFLIEHAPSPSSTQGTRRVMFDLGFKLDQSDDTPEEIAMQKMLVDVDYSIDVPGLLEREGLKDDVEAIIWSHWHVDHTGDPRRFASSVPVQVGPGMKERFLPGTPINPQSPIKQAIIEGRDVQTIDFDTNPLQIAGLDAFDYFGDGSFYLLSTPGHAVGHMCGLARTRVEPPSFVLLGGDACSHISQLRPSAEVPLPLQVSPNPLTNGELESETPLDTEPFVAMHPQHSRTRPFHGIGKMYNADLVGQDPVLATKTLLKLQTLDGLDNVFTILAHDYTIQEVADMYPKTVDDWMAKGWKQKCTWKFLEEFKDIVGK